MKLKIKNFNWLAGRPVVILNDKTAKKMNKLLTQLYVQKNSYNEVMNAACLNIKKLRCIPAIQPIENKNLKRIASGYGMRFHPILRIRKLHRGMDFAAPRGTDVYATGYGGGF